MARTKVAERRWECQLCKAKITNGMLLLNHLAEHGITREDIEFQYEDWYLLPKEARDAGQAL